MQQKYSPNKDASQGRGSYFSCIVIPLGFAKARRRPRYLSPAANSLEIRIAGRQPKYLSLKYLSPAADSLYSRIVGCQPMYQSPMYLSSAADSLYSRIVGCQPMYLSPMYLSSAANSLCSRVDGGQPRYPNNVFLSLIVVESLSVVALARDRISERKQSTCPRSHPNLLDNDSTAINDKKTLFGVHAQVSWKNW